MMPRRPFAAESRPRGDGLHIKPHLNNNVARDEIVIASGIVTHTG